jgi:cyclopropane fatty-acyl-phospholipid synthase-like methyltransferase
METGERYVTTDYWKSFWLSHAKESQHTGPQAQVLRTLNKQPISEAVFAEIIDSIVAMLKPEQGNKLLDLCCGNGVITRELLSRFQEVAAVDLSEEFISQLNRAGENNLTAFAADARTVDFPEDSFDRILLYAGVQYFSDSETIDLFMKLRRWVRDGGLVVLGDIPDATRKWNFFDSPDRERVYFEGLRINQPLVGNWFEPLWMEKLSHHAGFSSAVTRLQPASHPYHHYRFDLVLA